MPKATNNSAHGKNSLYQAEEMVLSSQKGLSNSEQEPDPEVFCHQFRPPNQSKTCLCHTLKVSKWTGQLMMGFTIGF